MNHESMNQIFESMTQLNHSKFSEQIAHESYKSMNDIFESMTELCHSNSCEQNVHESLKH